MAQDWWDAFGVGENDKTICCTDTNGVAMVCIQALHRLLEEARQETAQLRQRLNRLEQRAIQEWAARTLTCPRTPEVRPPALSGPLRACRAVKKP